MRIFGRISVPQRLFFPLLHSDLTIINLFIQRHERILVLGKRPLTFPRHHQLVLVNGVFKLFKGAVKPIPLLWLLIAVINSAHIYFWGIINRGSLTVIPIDIKVIYFGRCSQSRLVLIALWSLNLLQFHLGSFH